MSLDSLLISQCSALWRRRVVTKMRLFLIALLDWFCFTIFLPFLGFFLAILAHVISGQYLNPQQTVCTAQTLLIYSAMVVSKTVYDNGTFQAKLPPDRQSDVLGRLLYMCTFLVLGSVWVIYGLIVSQIQLSLTIVIVIAAVLALGSSALSLGLTIYQLKAMH